VGNKSPVTNQESAKSHGLEFKYQLTIDISTISPSYWSYKPTERYRLGAPPCNDQDHSHLRRLPPGSRSGPTMADRRSADHATLLE